MKMAQLVAETLPVSIFRVTAIHDWQDGIRQLN